MGRQRKPTHLRMIEGTRDRRSKALQMREPRPTESLNEPPEWFSPPLVEGWNFALAHAPLGLLKEIDRAMLTSWVVAEHIHRTATEKLLATQLLIKSPSGAAVKSPFLSIINRQAVLMKSLAAEMGFSPAARTRLAVDPAANTPDPTDRFFH